jgi:hypothetical protein
MIIAARVEAGAARAMKVKVTDPRGTLGPLTRRIYCYTNDYIATAKDSTALPGLVVR